MKDEMFSQHIVDNDILGCPSVAGCMETLVFHILKILYFHTWGSIDIELLTKCEGQNKKEMNSQKKIILGCRSVVGCKN